MRIVLPRSFTFWGKRILGLLLIGLVVFILTPSRLLRVPVVAQPTEANVILMTDGSPIPHGSKWEQITSSDLNSLKSNANLPSPGVAPAASGIQNVSDFALVPVNQSGLPSLNENHADQRAVELAQQLRATTPSERDEPKREELRRLLNESFTLKLETQEQRLAKLSEEVAQTKQQLENRRSNQAAIVDRRLRELLGNPDPMSWGYEPTSTHNDASGGANTPHGYLGEPVPQTLFPQHVPNAPLGPVANDPNSPYGSPAPVPRMPVYNPYDQPAQSYAPTYKSNQAPVIITVPAPATSTPPQYPSAAPPAVGVFSSSPPDVVGMPSETVPADLTQLGFELLDLNIQATKTELFNPAEIDNPPHLKILDELKEKENVWEQTENKLQLSLEKLESKLDGLNKLFEGEVIEAESQLRGAANAEIQRLNNRKHEIERQLDFMKKLEETIQSKIINLKETKNAFDTTESDEPVTRY